MPATFVIKSGLEKDCDFSDFFGTDGVIRDLGVTVDNRLKIAWP